MYQFDLKAENKFCENAKRFLYRMLGTNRRRDVAKPLMPTELLGTSVRSGAKGNLIDCLPQTQRKSTFEKDSIKHRF